MQSTFGKTIESRIIPSLSKTISRCADDAFKDWKNKIDSSINAMVSVSAHAHAEDTPERKKVIHVWSPHIKGIKGLNLQARFLCEDFAVLKIAYHW